MLRYVKHVFDNVHGYIGLTEPELAVVDSPAFQRLRRVKQLGPADLVYPGATHSRFSHSLGSCFLAGRLMEALFPWEGEDAVQLVRLAALIHDVGHPPLSHTLEGAMGVGHEEVGEVLVLEGELADALSSAGYSPREVAEVAWGENPWRVVISSPLDADRLDYLLRDSLHTGVVYGRPDVDRLLRVVRAVDVGGRTAVAVPERSVHVVEHFLLARSFMYRAVYTHKTVVSFELMYSKAYSLLVETGEAPRGGDVLRTASSESWRRVDDYWLSRLLRSSERVRELVDAVESRRPLKMVAEIDGASPLFGEAMRLAEDGGAALAAEAGVPPEWVVAGRPAMRVHVPGTLLVETERGLVEIERLEGGLVAALERCGASEREVVRFYAREDLVDRLKRALERLLGS